MGKLAPVVGAALLTALALLPGSAQAVVIKTRWVEKQELSSGHGFLRLYVRKIEVTQAGWTAWVGITNGTRARVDLDESIHPASHVGGVPFVYSSAPGLQWNTYVASGGNVAGGGGQSITHSRKATRVQSTYPTSLARGKSWFGVFAGSLNRVPKDRLLRIGFGDFAPRDGTGKTLAIASTHQFKLPKRR